MPGVNTTHEDTQANSPHVDNNNRTSRKDPSKKDLLVWRSLLVVILLTGSLFGGWKFIESSLERNTRAAALTYTQAAAKTETAHPTSTPSQTPTPIATITPSITPSATMPVLGSTTRSEVDGMVSVYIPQGPFLMGNTETDQYRANAICNQYYWLCELSWFKDETPQHEVTLDGYWIDQTEVTNAMFAAFLNSPEAENQSLAIRPINLLYENGKWLIEGGYELHPVEGVSWFAANSYCAWAGRRLPTEAEWEKAARGLDARLFPWGDEAAITGEMANFCDLNCLWNARMGYSSTFQDDGYAESAPVGTFPAGSSPYGALDMAGNVWEWVADWYGEEYYQTSPAINPAGQILGSEYRVRRGGSWEDHPADLRTAAREHGDPEQNFQGLGFRCAHSP